MDELKKATCDIGRFVHKVVSETYCRRLHGTQEAAQFKYQLFDITFTCLLKYICDRLNLNSQV